MPAACVGEIHSPTLSAIPTEQTTRELGRMWLQDFLLMSAARRLLQYSQSDRETFSAAPWQELSPLFLARAALQMWPVIVTQALILFYYSLVLGPAYYLLLYVLPIVTFYPAQIRLRSTVEHGFEVGFRPASPQDYWVTRSTFETAYTQLNHMAVILD